jgi:hypothetical protein
MPTSTNTGKGQITIPKKVLFGLLGDLGRGPASLEAIADSIQGAVAREDERIRRQR